MKLKTTAAFLIIFSFAFMAGAQDVSQGEAPAHSPISAYRSYKDIGTVSVNVPTVVEVQFNNESIERSNFLVLDQTTDSFEPYYFKQEILLNEVPVTVSTNPVAGSASRMNDKDPRTYADFPLPENTQGFVQITLSGSKPITSSALTVLLDTNVALPNFVEIRALVEGQDRIVLANKRMVGHTILFPRTTSNRWTISFAFSQPLRISELRLVQDNATRTGAHAIRFLAQPNHSYHVYFNPDRLVTASVGEAGNLASAKDVKVLNNVSSQNNPQYVIADIDNDGVPDVSDNCISTPNPDQLDVNNNRRGDACDDFDQDGIINSIDDCPNHPNRDQRDTDSDGIGDVCDGEESRLTERYAWIPWLGIGFAGLVLIILLALTARSIHTPREEQDDQSDHDGFDRPPKV